MSLATLPNFERFFDRTAPALLLGISLVVGLAVALIGG
jgi:hypothetical protein